jgi:hypothetical protein
VEYGEDSISFFSIRDDEVHFKKNIPQLHKTQEQTTESEKDSFGERAFKAMTRANVNLDSAEEIPADDKPQRPGWMLEKKKEEMTEEEQYQVQEFEKKLKNHIEEREKKRKAMSAELVKLVKGNQAQIDEFDRLMCKLYMQRFDTEEIVWYHELEILYIIDSLNNERTLKKILDNKDEENTNLKDEIRGTTNLLTELSAEHSTSHGSSSKAESDLEQKRLQVMKEFRTKECSKDLNYLYNRVFRRIKPKISDGPNTFQHFLQGQFVFANDTKEINSVKPPSLIEPSWNNFQKYCEDKLNLSRDAAIKNFET